LNFIFHLLQVGEEVHQSITLKCLLILAQNKKNISILTNAGTVNYLKNVIQKTKNRTLILGCEKTIAFLS